ncbi:MAG: glycosyltransferase [Actinomycetota bacterium]|nr:glycosyltransferase [Actinomycetota bacterium]
MAGIEPGFLLCVARLLPYKNVDAVIAAAERLPEQRMVVVGHGPDWHRLYQLAPGNVRLLGTVADDELRWLYANCKATVAASYEDYGLFPLEGAAFGKPTAALRWGGFLDTVIEDVTGVFFDQPSPNAIHQAVLRLQSLQLDARTIRQHAGNYSEDRFIATLRHIVDNEAKN